MAKVRLDLFKPEQVKPERTSRLAHPKRYGAWLESLPLGNMTAAGNKLLVALQEMNQAELSYRQRMEMLDQTVAPVLTVVGVLDKHYSDATFPLDDKRDRVGRVAVQFFREMSLGYRIAAADLVGGATSAGFLHRKAVARCLHHALAGFEQMLYRHALLYQNPPPQVWREINVLYAFARQNNIHRKVLDTDLQLSTRCSIEDLYLRMALFGISEPSRLGQRAMRAVGQAVALWAARVEVVDGLKLDGVEEGVFEIDVDSDDPPLLITEKQVPGTFELAMDIRALRSWLLEAEQEADGGLRDLTFTDVDGKSMIIDRDLINLLVSTWGVRRRRSFQRLQAQHELTMFVGIFAAHYVLAGEGPFARFLRDFGDQRFAEAASRDRPRFGVGMEVVEGRRRAYTAQVLNQSIGGYRVRLSDIDRLQLRVGELVIVCASSIYGSDPLWMLGAVRWLNAIDVREIEIGLSILGRDPVAAAVLAREGGNAVPLRAIGYHPFRGEVPGETHVALSTATAIPESVDLCVGSDHEPYCGPVDVAGRVERTSEIQFCRFTRAA